MSISPIFTPLELFRTTIGEAADTVPSDNPLIGSRIRFRRISRGISLRELGKQLGIKSDHLAAYEAGVEHINANLLFRVAELLDVRPDFFFRASSKEDAKAA